ncbi:MAG: FAD-dependent oxidoreductase [Victivallaceae bacterium]
MEKVKEFDLIIIGAGAAGTLAAIAAGRKGLKTLLVEKENCAGGMVSSGLLSIWGPFDDGEKRIIKGLPEEILQRLVDRKFAENRKTGFIAVDPEGVKLVLDEFITEAGVEVLYHTILAGAETESNLIEEITLATKSGKSRVKAQIYIDASGDGDLAAQSGVSFVTGKPETGWVQPMSSICRLGGIDENLYHWEGNFRYRNEIKQAIENGEITFDADGIGCATYVPGLKGVIAVNMSHVSDLDPLSAQDVSKAEIIGRKQCREILLFFRKYVTGCAEAFLIDTGMQIGIRESRRIQGKYMLTAEDILAGREFPDNIAVNAYHIDIHIPSKEKTSDTIRKPKKYYGIPFRSLLPLEVNNLIVTGRCISCTHEALGSVRIMPCCMAMGQAAGTAAFLAIQNHTIPGNIDISQLQDMLFRDKACLG